MTGPKDSGCINVKFSQLPHEVNTPLVFIYNEKNQGPGRLKVSQGCGAGVWWRQVSNPGSLSPEPAHLSVVLMLQCYLYFIIY